MKKGGRWIGRGYSTAIFENMKIMKMQLPSLEVFWTLDTGISSPSESKSKKSEDDWGNGGVATVDETTESAEPFLLAMLNGGGG